MEETQTMTNLITIQNQHQSHGLWKLHSIIKQILIIIDKKKNMREHMFYNEGLTSKTKIGRSISFILPLSLGFVFWSPPSSPHFLPFAYENSLSLSEKKQSPQFPIFLPLILYLSIQSPNLFFFSHFKNPYVRAFYSKSKSFYVRSLPLSKFYLMHRKNSFFKFQTIPIHAHHLQSMHII